MRSEFTANQEMASPVPPSSRAVHRQHCEGYRISHCLVTRTYWERVWAAICNYL